MFSDCFCTLWTVSALHISFKDQNRREVSQKRAYLPLATSEEQFQYTEHTSSDPETISPQIVPEATPRDGSSTIQYNGNDGKPGFISFYNPRNKTEDIIAPPESQSTWGRLLWLIGPAVLVSSFILPPIYLRRIVSAVFEDSLLTGSSCFSLSIYFSLSLPKLQRNRHKLQRQSHWNFLPLLADFLILFFTEALFYCGVAAFLLIIDRSRNSSGKIPQNLTIPSQLGQRISSVATLVLSLMIPMVTMGFVWPWTGPAASATLAPYLVGIVVQFAFEQYARYRNSPSSPVIPIIFQVCNLSLKSTTLKNYFTFNTFLKEPLWFCRYTDFISWTERHN